MVIAKHSFAASALALLLWTCGDGSHDGGALQADDAQGSLILPDLYLYEAVPGQLAPGRSEPCKHGIRASLDVEGDTIESLLLNNFDNGNCATKATRETARFYSLQLRATHCGSPVYEGVLDDEDSRTRKVIVIDYSQYDCEWNKPPYLISVTEIEGSLVRRYTGAW